MARAKLGALLTELSGSIGNTTFQNSNAGTTVRSKPSVAGNFSTTRQTCRNYNFQIQQAWKALSTIDQTQWQTFATFVNVKQKNSSYLNISGQALFYQINFYRLLYGIAILTIPVFSNSRPAAITCTLFRGPAQLTVIYSRPIVLANEFIILSITNIISNSVNNFKNKLKIIPYTQTLTNAEIITTYYINIYGALPNTGDTVGLSWSSAYKANGLFMPFQSAKITL